MSSVQAGEKAFSLFYYRDGRLIAVDSVNRPGEHLLARKLLDAGVSPDPALAADPASDLRSLIALMIALSDAAPKAPDFVAIPQQRCIIATSSRLLYS